MSWVNFWLGARIARHADDDSLRKRYLVASVAFSLGVLGFFKYTNFFIDSALQLLELLGLGAHRGTLNVILPIGVSFFTFHVLSYTIDIYRRRLEPEPSFVAFAAYIALFPHMVAGPIVRASRLLPQLRSKRTFRWVNLFVGLEQIVIGLCLKVVLADNLGPIADRVFASPDAFNALSLTIAVLFFAFQIYGDFAGYSLIAIGLARIMGFNFGLNFKRPYIARDFSEFWRRWHISLSAWLRDYLYIFALGGNRGGGWATQRNLLLTMVLGGLWHGAAWTFVVWGALHGLYLVLQRLVAPVWLRACDALRTPAFLRALVSTSTVFALTCVAWVFFRAQSLADALTVFERILFSGDFRLSGVDRLTDVATGFAFIAVLLALDFGRQWLPFRRMLRRQRLVRALAGIVLFLAIPLFGSFKGAQFIYFQF
jgi:D-alanyl-lipoteichoic acid acyltransferase DltB (MBOAT superfamily)